MLLSLLVARLACAFAFLDPLVDALLVEVVFALQLFHPVSLYERIQADRTIVVYLVLFIKFK